MTTIELKGNVILGSDAGTTTAVTGTLKSNTLDATAINSAQTIGSNVTTGSITIGSGLTTGDINIGTNLTGNGGNVSIASGSGHVAGSYINFGSDQVPYSYIRAQNIEMNTNGSGNTYIGTPAVSTTSIQGQKFPLRVVGPSENGAAFIPVSGFDNHGNLSIWSTFPSIVGPPQDIEPRRIVDLVAGFAANDWFSSYLSLGVGPTNGVENDAQNITAEQMRISMTTITVNKPITIGYTPSALTDNTMIGHTSTSIIGWSGIADAVIANSPSLPIGTYNVNICFELNGTFIPSFLYTYSTGAGPIMNNSVPFVNGGDRILANGSFILQLTTPGTFALTNYATNDYVYTSPGYTVNSVFVSTGGLYITRIA